jgi:hypothetical protein
MAARALAQTYTDDLYAYMLRVYTHAVELPLVVPPDVSSMVPGAQPPLPTIRSVAEMQNNAREPERDSLHGVYRVGKTLQESQTPVVDGLGMLRVYEKVVRDEERQVELLMEAYLSAMISAVTCARYLAEVLLQHPQRHTRDALTALAFPSPGSVESYGSGLKKLTIDIDKLEASLVAAMAADIDALAKRAAAVSARRASASAAPSGFELGELFGELQNACELASDALRQRLDADYPELLRRVLDASSTELTDLVPLYAYQLRTVFEDLAPWLLRTIQTMPTRRAYSSEFARYGDFKLRQADDILDTYARAAGRLSQTVPGAPATRSAEVLLTTDAFARGIMPLYAIFRPVIGTKAPRFAREQIAQELLASLRQPTDVTRDALRRIVEQLDDYLGREGAVLRFFDQTELQRGQPPPPLGTPPGAPAVPSALAAP